MTATPSSFEERLATALHVAATQPRAALPALRALVAEAPQQVLSRYALVRALLQIGEADAAFEIARHPGLLDAPDALAESLADFAAAGASSQHVELLKARAIRHPQDYRAALALAARLHGLGRPSEAVDWSRRAQALRPDQRQPVEIWAASLIDRGDVERGLALYRNLLARADDAEAAARYLVLMHYDPAQSNRELFDALQAYAKRHLPAPGNSFAQSRTLDAEGGLRIGWLSPRFNDGPVATFLTGLLGAFDRARHRHFLVALQPAADDASVRLRSLADEWFDFSGLDANTLLQRLRALELDVMIDLAGHSTANRISVIAQRVAPVQACWLDWFDTTAVPAMDAWISDAWLTPDDSTQRYTERLVRLPSGRFCYTPPSDAPPATHAGGDAVVFASFNRLSKLNDDVVAAWSAILERVPGSKLCLGARMLGEPATCAYTVERFGAHGIAAERLRLSGLRSHADLLAAYREVDIALDPFPFSGGTTTCDALFMGCPAITLPGETFVSRQSASLLWRLGRDEWVAHDRKDYVERAVALAASVAELRAGRERQRETVLVRLCDAARHAQEFAASLRELVRDQSRHPRIG